MIDQRLNTYPYSIGHDKRQKQRQQAELQRNLLDQQHLEVVTNLIASEEQRLINEELRASAEAERQESEKQRRVSEHWRISAEKLRQVTEEARVVAEMLRKAAEDDRQSTHEQQLVLDEMRRAAQEFDRINLELRPNHK